MATTEKQKEDLVMAGFSIGGIKVYPGTSRMEVAGKAKRLEPKIMDLLVYFASHSNQVLSKEQLLKDVWGGVPVVEEALQRAISLLRKTLGDDRENPRFIETISKKGYRFLIHPRPLGKNDVLEIDYQKKTLKVSPIAFLIGAALIVLVTYLLLDNFSEVAPPAPKPDGLEINQDHDSEAPPAPKDEGAS